SSSISDVLVTGVGVDGIVFNGGAFTIATITGPAGGLGFVGAGITNNSGNTQNFMISDYGGSIGFANNATAGVNTLFTQSAIDSGGVVFYGASTAGSATFRNIPGVLEF